MDVFMLKLFNMSLTAIWLIAAVVLLRFVFAKAPKNLRLVLWGAVCVRLLCPFSFESVLSLLPSSEPVENILPAGALSVVDMNTSGVNTTGTALPADVTVEPLHIIFFVWLAGVCGMLVYMLISRMRMAYKVKASIKLEDNIYMCDEIVSPFILGIFRPRIYLPSGIDSLSQTAVIAHERTHIKRLDNLLKPFGFIVLTVHWFNPFVWLAYLLFCRDTELACDERVIKDMTAEEKKNYSEILFSMSTKTGPMPACPLAFGETGVKDRIKSILSYKKPAVWLIVIAVIVCTGVSAAFLLNPPSDKNIDGIHYIDKYYFDLVIGEERANNENRDVSYRIDPQLNLTKQLVNGGGIISLGRLEKQEPYDEAEVRMILDKLPSVYNEDRIEEVYTAVYGSTRHTFIKFSNGRFIGAFVPFDSSGKQPYYVSQVFSLKRSPDVVVADVTSPENDFFVTQEAPIKTTEADTSSAAKVPDAEIPANYKETTTAVIIDTENEVTALVSGTVKKSESRYIVLEVFEGQTGFSDNALVHVFYGDKYEKESFKKGDYVTVAYDGMVQETYPLQINNVYYIEPIYPGG